MIFLGYNFLQDKCSWQPTPTNLTNINNVTLQNGIYNHFNVTRDVTSDYVTTIPTAWDLNTQMDATFDGTINAGNIDYVVAQISSIKVKKRKKGSFKWYTLYNVPVSSVSDIDFVKYDYLSKNNTEYEYAIVPILGNVEGEYSINSIESNFYGVFISDSEDSYKFLEGVSYSNNERVRPVATYQPYSSKYPIVISNGDLNYEVGTVTGNVIVYTDNEGLDREGTISRLENIKDFLTNGNGKILKDFNGNIWLVAISGDPTANYVSEVGLGFAQLSFNWTEIGDSDDTSDLYNNNLIYDKN